MWRIKDQRLKIKDKVGLFEEALLCSTVRVWRDMLIPDMSRIKKGGSSKFPQRLRSKSDLDDGVCTVLYYLGSLGSSWSPRPSVFPPCSDGAERVDTEISAGTTNQGTFAACRGLFSNGSLGNDVGGYQLLCIIARSPESYRISRCLLKAPKAAVNSREVEHLDWYL